jgi:N-acetylglucosaminyldiphosphoundecaprenol N-acetyl-beta-D-mannosaminyltransferase
MNAPPTRRPNKPRVRIGKLLLDPVTFDEAVAFVFDSIQNHRQEGPTRISCPNAQLVDLGEDDPNFAHIIATSNLVVADGLPLVWASRLLGNPLPAQIRGVDLMERICSAGAARTMSIYILGGLPGAAEIAAQRLTQNYPGLQLAGADCPPAGFEQNPALNRQVRQKIEAAKPGFLIVALGSPKQEQWIDRNCRDLPIGAIQGVGAAVDTYAGLRSRPPQWMQSTGLEWLGRLLAEPGRLWRRYIFGNTRFVWIIFRQRLTRRSTE